MNENPEGTPNPLNPNPGETLTGSEPVAPVEQSTPVEQPTQLQPEPEQPKPATEPTPSTDTPKDQSSAVQKPKKKTGLIIAIVLFILAIAGGVAAAIIVLNPSATKKDAVSAAIAKLIGGNAPKLVITEGDINVSSSSDSIPVSSVNIKIKSEVNEENSETHASAKVAITLEDDTELSLNADEVSTAGGNLYLKFSDIEGFHELVYDDDDEYDDYDDYDDYDEMQTDIGDALTQILNFFSMIEGQWIKISLNSSSFGFSNISPELQCLLNTVRKTDEYGSELAGLYNENKFIDYTTDNLKVAQKKNTLYQLKIDSEKIAGFMNSASDSKFMKKSLECVGGNQSIKDIEAGDLQETIDYLPEVYVEIDGEDNFTRAYITNKNQNSQLEVTADLLFSYPATLTISEPTDYIDMDELLSGADLDL